MSLLLSLSRKDRLTEQDREEADDKTESGSTVDERGNRRKGEGREDMTSSSVHVTISYTEGRKVIDNYRSTSGTMCTCYLRGRGERDALRYRNLADNAGDWPTGGLGSCQG